ncbi:MAG: thermonuclease family protein [Candidatus Woesebacteria bacterium]|jgi:micrococcal nuclease
MSRKNALTSIITLLIVLFASALYGMATDKVDITQAPEAGYYEVIKFTDGDTITVSMNGTEEKIRLIGVDTPETKKPNSPVQCYGKEASSFTESLIGNNDVKLEADPVGDNRDRYDRLLRYVYLPDGTLVNKEIIGQGYGFAYLSFDFSKSDEFATAQEEAQNSKLGLWYACTPKEESSGRWQTEDL